ncbi:DGQHR domain-containing protein [Dyadobacter frigoris]|uniref:DGQHR domain-containing protein n=1 Tax=Dyadobacter frigoris TaxID=2576211 RepID=A0A4U6D970_9BACT|nr:DGQHR domain-containing protein [Dyadobacter frigoris]TKT94062.1 DGQHR domain-containing protein [Dyadobacter frigoris]
MAKKSSRTVKAKSLKAKTKKSSPAVLTDQQKEQNLQEREIRSLMLNMGFSRVSRVDGKEFIYDGRTSELDDIFYYENVIVLTEYTISKSVSSHLINKKIIYDKITDDPYSFIQFLLEHSQFKEFKEDITTNLLSKYSLRQLQVKVIYVSKYQVADEHKGLIQNIKYFDYPIFKYFEKVAKIIKKTAKYEFFDFLEISFSKIGNNINSTSTGASEDFSGHILPEEHSSFEEGYKLVSFYIDAQSLLKRAFVLRNEGWRDSSNVGHYQRMLNPKKMRSMRKYLHEEQRVFINNIIVTIPIDNIKLIDRDGKELIVDEKGLIKNSEETKVQPALIKIENKSNIIGIIDGQHRSYSYYEGDDAYEATISKLRKIQNLLITGILYPKNENQDKRLKFEAKLFLEINANQAGAPTHLKQEIESLLHPFSIISISKYIISQLNLGGPLGSYFEQYSYESSKIKTSSIISFGLRPLIKLDGNDSIYKIWNNPGKGELKTKIENFDLLQEYKNFCVSEIRNIFIAFKENISKQKWSIDKTNDDAILNVTTINGMINCLRLLIKNERNGDITFYNLKLKEIDNFDFKKYKSSQYRQMGQDLFDEYFYDPNQM